MVKFHPVFVHFPVALLLLAGLMAFISLFAKAKKEEWKTALIKILIVGTAFAALAVISGLIEEESLKHNEAIHKILILHKYNGLGIFFFFSSILIWYFLRRKIMRNNEYAGWALSVSIGSVLMLWQGYLGGEMVYNHGAGVKPMEFLMEGKGGHDHKQKQEEKMKIEMNKKDVGKRGMNIRSADTVPDKKQLKDMKY